MFGFVYWKTSTPVRRKLWWLSPLVLFASPALLDRIILGILLMVAASHGGVL